MSVRSQKAQNICVRLQEHWKQLQDTSVTNWSCSGGSILNRMRPSMGVRWGVDIPPGVWKMSPPVFIQSAVRSSEFLQNYLTELLLSHCMRWLSGSGLVGDVCFNKMSDLKVSKKGRGSQIVLLYRLRVVKQPNPVCLICVSQREGRDDCH